MLVHASKSEEANVKLVELVGENSNLYEGKICLFNKAQHLELPCVTLYDDLNLSLSSFSSLATIKLSSTSFLLTPSSISFLYTR